MLRKRKGQSTLEYALIIAAVVAALIIMSPYLKRSVQGRVRASSDQIGDQFEHKDKFTFQRQIFGGKDTGGGETKTEEKRDAAAYYDASGGAISTTIVKSDTSEKIETRESDKWDAGATLGDINP